jgi:nickel superoxide dismutase
MKKTFIILGILIFLASGVYLEGAYSHCQIPCGIYDDAMRIKMIAEDIATVEKSMNMINDLSKEEDKNYNQIVRWVNNKETHADKISEAVTYYFMAQRIKLPEAASGKEYEMYVKRLSLLHEMLVLSMKAKQTTDLSYVSKLRETLKKFEQAYLEK